MINFFNTEEKIVLKLVTSVVEKYKKSWFPELE